MRPGRRHRAGRRPRPAGDAGFTMVEVLVSIAVIGVIMTALTTFFVTTVSATSRQGQQQVAIQLATDGSERIRSIKNSAIVGGRDRTSSDNQWASPDTGAAPYLADMAEIWDHDAVFPAGASAPLPTTARIVTVNGVDYGQHWYLGECWQPEAGGDCTGAAAAGLIRFFRVVVSVTWPDGRCPGSLCAYVLSTLVNSTFEDPVFNSNQTALPPAVNNPGEQYSDLSVPVSLKLTAVHGAPPLTWSATGLPPGLSIGSDGSVGGTPTTAGVYRTVVKVIDGFSLARTAAFGWTVSPLPTLPGPGVLTSTGGTAISRTLPVVGGTAPLTWSAAPGPWGATGLPPGLAIDPATGAITGTPTELGSKSVTITVTDVFRMTASVTFTWTIPPLQVPAVTAPAAQVGTAIAALPLIATGGIAPYTWTVVDLPPGLSMTPAGVLSGTPTAGTRYLVTATVTDSAASPGNTAPVTFEWIVTTATGMRVTMPTADRTGDLVGQSVTIDAAAAGATAIGTAGWTATGLPPGVTMAPTGQISGVLGKAGSYRVTLTTRDSVDPTMVAVFMFTWTVT